MNYTNLEEAVQDYCKSAEPGFVSHINDFIKTTEDRVYAAVSGPLFWNASTSVSTVSGTNAYTTATGTLDILGVRLCETASGSIDTSGPFRYLIRRDVDFLFEAFPGTVAGLETGIPRYYAVTSVSDSAGEPVMQIRLGPTPDAIYNTEIEHYGKSATDSITSGNTPGGAATTTTWLSVAFPDVLLFGAVHQAYIYLKGDADVMGYYEGEFNKGLMLLKNIGESRQDTDTYSDQGDKASQA